MHTLTIWLPVSLSIYFSRRMFRKTLAKWMSRDNGSARDDEVVNNEVLEIHKERTNRHLRTRDLIYEKSSQAVLIVT